jgi:hypothetical protein
MMMKPKIASALAAAALLCACEAKIGKNADAEGGATAARNGNAGASPAEGKAEEGSFSIDAPGFDMKIAIPEGMANRTNVDSDSDILYPGSTLSGMHVEADKDGGAKGGRSGVELRFTSADAPDKIAAWYREPGRSFAVASAAREGEGYVISGTEKGDGDPFTVRLAPKNGGGTEGRLALTDRN